MACRVGGEHLTFTPSEESSCAASSLPSVRTKADGYWRARAARTTTTYGPTSGSDYVNVTNYTNCSAVPYALKPLTRTEPGYEPRLDADSDGLACEV